MRSVLSPAHLLLMICLTALGAAPAPAGVYVHPARAYSFDAPFAWRTLNTVDAAGAMHQIFTPQWTDDPAKVERGYWVYTLPIPSDAALNEVTACNAAHHFFKRNALSLAVDTTKRTATKVGDKLQGWSMPAEGKLPGGAAWKGEVRVAFTIDCLFLIAAGGAPKESDAVLKDVDKSLAKFAAPLAFKPFSEPAVPKEPQRLKDVADKLRSSTMMLRMLVPDPKDPNRLVPIDGTGTGFLVHPDGYLITNRHVVERGQAWMTRRHFDPMIATFDQSVRRDEIIADVVAISYRWDVALLKLRGNDKWPSLPIADFASVDIGHDMALIGWPKPNETSYYNITLNTGTVSRVERDHKLRATELVCGSKTGQGNSGGPIYDLDLGGVIGALNKGVSVENYGVKEFMYTAAVPIDKALWDFPQVLSAEAEKAPKLSDKEWAALVRFYIGQQRYGAAMIECRRALEKDPKNSAAHVLQSYIYSVQGDPIKAAAALARAKDDPAAAFTVAYYGALSAIDYGDAAAARAHAEAAIRAQPDNLDAHLLLARAYALTLDTRAEAKLNEVIQKSGGSHPEAQGALGALAAWRWMHDNTYLFHAPNLKLADTAADAATQQLLAALGARPTDSGLARAGLSLVADLAGNDKAAGLFSGSLISTATYHLEPEAFLTLVHRELTGTDLDFIRTRDLMNTADRFLAVRESRYGQFVMGYALIQYWFFIRNVPDEKVKKEAAAAFDRGINLLNESISSGESVWWRPLALKITDIARRPQQGPAPQQNNPALTRAPAAGINTVQQEHGVTVNGRQGLIFHIDVDIVYAAGHECGIVLVIRDALDNALKGVSKEFTLGDGAMGAAFTVKPGGEMVKGYKVKIFAPYDDINAAAKGGNLQYQVFVFDRAINKAINGNRHQQQLHIPPPRQLQELSRDKGLVGKVTSMTPSYGVVKNGKKGLLFTADCSIFAAKGKEATLAVRFVDMRGRGELAARSKEYSDDKGMLVVASKFRCDDEKFFIKGVELFVPYEELGVTDEPSYMMYQAEITMGGVNLTEDQYDQAIRGMLQFNVPERYSRNDPRYVPRNDRDRRTYPREDEDGDDPRYQPPTHPRPDRRDPRGTTPETPTTPQAERPQPVEPPRRKFVSARINHATAVAGVEKDGKKGVMVSVTMGVFDAAGSKVEVAVSYADGRNRPIAAKNAAYSDNRGLLYAATSFDVKDDKFFPEAVQVFIPYTELVPGAGKHTIRYTVTTTREGRQLAQGPRNTIEFTVDAKDLK